MFRKLATLGCFLLLLATLIASNSKAVDQWIVFVVWMVFLVGSAVLVVRNFRQPPEKRGAYFTQLSLLPRRWQRWVLDEPEPKKAPKVEIR